jgi:uncharacterized protein YecT (DUF1311 family)
VKKKAVAGVALVAMLPSMVLAADEAVGRLDGMRALLADPTTTAAARYRAAERWCKTEGYPNELSCSFALVAASKIELEHSFEQAQAIAIEVDRTRHDVCREDDTGECETNDVSELLANGQSAWETYRDTQCVIESDQARGGWGENANWNFCVARLSGARIDDLVGSMRFYAAQFIGPSKAAE